jgi:hypothetical protein
MEVIILIALVIVVVVALLKGVNININFNYPEVAAPTIEDNLYDDKGEAKDDPDDYLEEVLKELHALMQEDNLDG